MGADDLGGDESFGRMTGDLLPFQVSGAVLPGISPGLAFVLPGLCVFLALLVALAFALGYSLTTPGDGLRSSAASRAR